MSDIPRQLRAQRQALIDRLRQQLPTLDARLRLRALETVADRVLSEVGPETGSVPLLLTALARAADGAVGGLSRLAEQTSTLLVAYRGAVTEAERREVLVRHLTATVHDPLRLAGDVRATRRYLDFEAVHDRLNSEAADRSDEIELAYRLIASLSTAAPRLEPDIVERVLGTALEHARICRNDAARTAALVACSAVLERTAEPQRAGALGVRIRLVSGWATAATIDRWFQAAALELCTVALPHEALDLISQRLRDRAPRDSLIVRSAALRLLGRFAGSHTRALRVALIARDDPSEHVRQQLAVTLAALGQEPAIDALAALCRNDASPRVRAFAVRRLSEAASRDPFVLERARAVLLELFRDSSGSLLLRVALEGVERLCLGRFAVTTAADFVPSLDALLRRDGVPPEVIQLSALVLRALEVDGRAPLEELRARFETELSSLPEGKSRRLSLDPALTSSEIERALIVACRGDMTVSLRRARAGRYVLTRGEPRRLRLWRLLHEIAHPAPDKRKGFSHSTGRRVPGSIVVPGSGMAEVTPTRVPGERRYGRAVAGWGPFLPRVDELLASARPWSGPLRIATGLGTVTVRGPKRASGRLRAWFELSRRYAFYARERERSLEAREPHDRVRFSRLVETLGFSFELGDTEGEVRGARFSVKVALATRYLGLFLPFTLPFWADDVIARVLSPHDNSAWHLSIVAWIVFSTFTLRAAWQLHRIERQRRLIPLTIGGWGTRGKSGSERLKAALLHALRYDVVVKTTGCEAMFIHARRDRPAHEIFLYRPYDKATIWEQRDVLQSAYRLRAQAFLWECMALQPTFVNLLAREWMKDEITTLTNAYPDHEDVMGPTGEDVARVIGLFMPLKGTTFTSEEQMLPLLKDAARRAKTELVVVPPIEAELLPQDLLSRFPYDEHPLNIALIARLAEYLGVDRERALIAMADYVVPDLGVLKTYPEVRHRGRALVFSNGMSANERAGFMSNWTRLGFDRHDQDTEPDTVTVTVVNNRADRVPRSRVFAEIMVRDIAVNRIVLIGTNLGGMVQFITEALDSWLPELSVAGEGGVEGALARYDAALRRLKIPLAPGAGQATVARMLQPLGLSDAERTRALEAIAAGREPTEAVIEIKADVDTELLAEVAEHAARLARDLDEADQTREAIRRSVTNGDVAAADQALRTFYRRVFLDKIAVVARADTPGDGVIDFIAQKLPPGHRARLMGCQNIKGTGLDFVYRWLSIAAVRATLDRLRSEPGARTELLSWLLAHADFGLLDCREAMACLSEVVDQAKPEWAQHQTLVLAVLERLRHIEAEKLARIRATGDKPLFHRVLDRIEPFVDHWDSVRRRRRATRVMEDLFELRIGQGRCALLLRDLVAREKGGWLAKDVIRWSERRRRRTGAA